MIFEDYNILVWPKTLHPAPKGALVDYLMRGTMNTYYNGDPYYIEVGVNKYGDEKKPVYVFVKDQVAMFGTHVYAETVDISDMPIRLIDYETREEVTL